MAKEGDIVVLQNAFARKFSGVIELNLGADGKILPYKKDGDVTYFREERKVNLGGLLKITSTRGGS